METADLKETIKQLEHHIHEDEAIIEQCLKEGCDPFDDKIGIVKARIGGTAKVLRELKKEHGSRDLV